MGKEHDVQARIDYKKIKAVMGWDIGDGDSVAFGRRMEKDGKLEPLYLHKSRDQQVEKTAVTRTDKGNIIIGEDVARQKEFEINFKRAPGKWNNKSGAMNMEYKQLMFDYIRGVSEAILQNSSNRDGTILKTVTTTDSKGNRQWKKDEVLLVVGCPASVIWRGEEMRRQYEKLISEAVGIRNVVVTEESRAAIFSLFGMKSLRNRIDLQKGVLVIDLGSSTADATYLLPGEKAVNVSWDLGASKIEYAMLDYILHSPKAEKELAKIEKLYNKNKVMIARDYCSHAVFQLRRDKEDFFGGKIGENAARQNIHLSMIDEDGDMILDEDGEPQTISIPYKVTEEMMDYAVNQYEFDVQKNGVTVSQGTWKQNCRRFLDDIRQTMEKEKVSVGTIVVTGGASNMPFTLELCRKKFSDSWVTPSDTPSHSVVKGLVTIAYNEVKAPAVRSRVTEDILRAGKEHIDSMIDKIACRLSEEAYDDAVSALDSMTAVCEDDGFFEKMVDGVWFDSNVGDITDTVQNAIQNSLSRNTMVQIKCSVDEWTKADHSEIIKRVNKASVELYADKAISDMIKIHLSDVNTISKNVSLPDISMPDVAADANFIGAVVGCILSGVLWIILSLITVAVPMLAGLLIGVGFFASSYLIEKMQKYRKTPVSDGSIAKAVRKMKKEKQSKLGEIKEPLKTALYEAFTRSDAYGPDFEKYYKLLTEITNKAFDRILLETEDGRQ